MQRSILRSKPRARHCRVDPPHRWVLALAMVLLAVIMVGCTSDERSTQTREEATADGREAYEAGNYTTAYDELYPIAKDGDPLSEFYIGRMYHFGEGRDRDLDKAVKWYRRSAEAGAAQAQYLLGRIYDVEKGYKNREQAIKWYSAAAENGVPDAMHSLGYVYQEQGALEEAFNWKKKAADEGSAAAQFDVGLCYQNGKGIDEDDDQALKYFRRSSRQGNVRAMVAMAVIYDEGSGVERDLRKVYQWFSLAAEHDWDGAAEEVRKLEKALDRQALAEARSMTSKWRDKYLAE